LPRYQVFIFRKFVFHQNSKFKNLLIYLIYTSNNYFTAGGDTGKSVSGGASFVQVSKSQDWSISQGFQWAKGKASTIGARINAMFTQKQTVDDPANNTKNSANNTKNSVDTTTTPANNTNNSVDTTTKPANVTEDDPTGVTTEPTTTNDTTTTKDPTLDGTLLTVINSAAAGWYSISYKSSSSWMVL
jgi:hypothetical protein